MYGRYTRYITTHICIVKKILTRAYSRVYLALEKGGSYVDAGKPERTC